MTSAAVRDRAPSVASRLDGETDGDALSSPPPTESAWMNLGALFASSDDDDDGIITSDADHRPTPPQHHGEENERDDNVDVDQEEEEEEEEAADERGRSSRTADDGDHRAEDGDASTTISTGDVEEGGSAGGRWRGWFTSRIDQPQRPDDVDQMAVPNDTDGSTTEQQCDVCIDVTPKEEESREEEGADPQDTTSSSTRRSDSCTFDIVEPWEQEKAGAPLLSPSAPPPPNYLSAADLQQQQSQSQEAGGAESSQVKSALPLPSAPPMPPPSGAATPSAPSGARVVPIDAIDVVALEEGRQLPLHDSNNDSNDNDEQLPTATAPIMADATIVVPDDASVNSTTGQLTPRVHWDDRLLPVATPIFDADVSVWSYDRPRYRRRFGHGFFGNRPHQSEGDGRGKKRDPIFTDEDRANPFRCGCKVLGMVAALPLYLLYLLIKGAWLIPAAHLVDGMLVRPFGWIIDGVVYVMKSISWVVYYVLMVPLYKVGMVYPFRILRYVVLTSLHGLLRMTEVVYIHAIVPVAAVVKKVFDWTWNHTVDVIRWTWDHTVVVLFVGLQDLGAFVHKRLLMPLASGVVSLTRGTVKHVFVPCYEGFTSGIVWMYKHIIVPLVAGIRFLFRSAYKYILVPIAIGIRWFAKSVASGIRLMLQSAYRYVLVPIATGLRWAVTTLFVGIRTIAKGLYQSISCVLKGIWKGLVQPMYLGFVSGVTCMYKSIIKPIVVAVVAVVKYVYHGVTGSAKWLYGTVVLGIVGVFVALGKGIRDHIFRPTRDAVLTLAHGIWDNVLSPVGRAVGSLLAALGNAVKEVGASIGATVKAVGTSIGAALRAVGSAIEIAFTRVASVFK